MTNADRMTHPIIPQRNQYVSLEYLESLGIDENFSSINATKSYVNENMYIDTSDYYTKTEIDTKLSNNVQVSLVSDYTLTVRGEPNNVSGYVTATLNKKPFTGLEIDFQCGTYDYRKSIVIGKVVFDSPTTITFTATQYPDNLYPQCSFDSENLTLKFTHYYEYRMSDVNSNTCVIRNVEKHGDNLRLTKNDTSYNIYTKEQVDALISALREEFINS